MIGNDVVDLLDEDSADREDQDRFDARVFALDERVRIAGALEPRTERWRLWSAKEAAYKAGRQLDCELVFSPRQFRVSRALDRVCYGDCEFELEIDEGANRVHSIARLDVGPIRGQVLSRVVGLSLREAADPQLASTRVRDLCRTEIARELGVDPDALRVESRARIPELLFPSGAKASLSLSHHGAWAAFACALPSLSRSAGSTERSLGKPEPGGAR